MPRCHTAPHKVIFVADDELPEGHDWAYVRADSGERWFFVKQSRAASPAVLSDALRVVSESLLREATPDRLGQFGSR